MQTYQEIPTTFFFHRDITNNPKISMEPQKTLHCQSNLKKKNIVWESEKHCIIDKVG